MSNDKEIQWIDDGREPKVAPNPDYPQGVDLDISMRGNPMCYIPLPYPAKRIGRYLIKCKTCGWFGIISTAGRADDPRSVKIACKQVTQ